MSGLLIETRERSATLFSFPLEGRSPGENGVAVSLRATSGAAFMALSAPTDHWLTFATALDTNIDCRSAGARLVHRLVPGCLAILPAGVDACAEIAGPTEALVLCVAPQRIAVTSAERSGRVCELVQRLRGHDSKLMDLASVLFAEAKSGRRNGPLFWNDAADRIVDHLVDNHLSHRPKPDGLYLSPKTVHQIADFIRSHLAEPIDVDRLAAIAGVGRFHFTRLFTRSVGMSPHRFLVKLRIDAAVVLLRERRYSLADAALATGFADQSHLSRWFKRVHGTTLSKLTS